MTTYQEYQQQIAQMHALAEQARSAELPAVKQQIAALMTQYGLSLADLAQPGEAGATRRPVRVRYRDSASGKTWSGQGRPPRWLQGKDRSQFLVA